MHIVFNLSARKQEYEINLVLKPEIVTIFINGVEEFHLESLLCVCSRHRSTISPCAMITFVSGSPHNPSRRLFQFVRTCYMETTGVFKKKVIVCENIHIAIKETQQRFREKCSVSRWESLPQTHSIKKIHSTS